MNEDYAEGKELLSNARKLFQDKQLENKDDQEHKYENESIDKRISPMIVVEYSPMSLSPRIINSNLLFTEISGFQRSELYEKELSLISPRLYADAGVKFLSF